MTTKSQKILSKDVVFRLNKKGDVEFGKVIDTYDECLENAYDCITGEYDEGQLKEGCILVEWYRTGEEEVVEANVVGLADRYLKPGRFVIRITNDSKGYQFGKCVDIKVTACVRVAGTKLIVINVPIEDLLTFDWDEACNDQRISFSVVCRDSWIGCILMVYSLLTLQTSDGSRCVIKYPHCPRTFHQKYKFYPGQTLSGLLEKLHEPSIEWLHRTDQLNPTAEATVESIESIVMDSVNVSWEFHLNGEGVFAKIDRFRTTISGEDLKKLEILRELPRQKLTVGDLKYYTLKEADTVTTKGRWRRALREAVLADGEGLFFSPLEHLRAESSRGEIDMSAASGNDQTSCMDIDTEPAYDFDLESTTDDSDPDEIQSTGDPRDRKRVKATLDLSAYFSSGNNKSSAPAEKTVLTLAKYLTTTHMETESDEAPGPVTVARFLSTYTLKKLRQTKKLWAYERQRLEALASAPSASAQVIVEVLCIDRRASIVWQDGTAEHGVPTTELFDFYPAMSVIDRQFFPGELVREVGSENTSGVYGVVQSADRVSHTAMVQWFHTEEPRPALLDRADVSAYDIEPYPGSHGPKASVIRVVDGVVSVGSILENLPEGKTRVRWLGGRISTCWPQHLRRAPILNDPSHEDIGASAQQQAVLDSSVRLVDFLCETAGAEAANEGGFSIANAAPDTHRFKSKSFLPTDPKLFLKAVREEIQTLRTSLPGGVWVKGFEDRPDLFSVMIRGPQHTPYEDGLFLFDLQLSSDYPKSPPSCHYRSPSRGPNPYFLAIGTVIESQRGTWKGTWTVTSNLLQVVVSIQRVVQVGEPYFNNMPDERGSERARWSSRLYNERAVLGALWSATALALQPPAAFREEIARHFAENARHACDRLEAWIELSERYKRGHQPVSQELPFPARNFPQPGFPLLPATKGFWISLRKNLKSLKEALLSAGIALNHEARPKQLVLNCRVFVTESS